VVPFNSINSLLIEKKKNKDNKDFLAIFKEEVKEMVWNVR